MSQKSEFLRKAFKKSDFKNSPLLVFYEVTRACDLACKHCRASAFTRQHPDQLSTKQGKDFIDELTRFPTPPLLVFTGGDPLKRSDLYELIAYAKKQGLTVAITPSATPLFDTTALHKLKEAGIDRLALSLDSPNAETHDKFRGFEGTFERTLQILNQASELGISLQINTTITKDNVHQLDEIADWLADKNIVLWSVFFLISIGRGTVLTPITPEQYEEVFERLVYHAATQPYVIKTTEAHHYRRFVLQEGKEALKKYTTASPDRVLRSPLGVNDGNCVMFVSHIGEIYPSGFLPLECGRFPQDSVVEVYQNNPLFQQLRTPNSFSGKCGVCEYNKVCGGSRARAFAATGDPLGSEPDCVYVPPRWKKNSGKSTML